MVSLRHRHVRRTTLLVHIPGMTSVPTLAVLAISGVLTIGGSPADAQPGRSMETVIRNVTVLDGTEGPPQRNRSVLVRGDRIVAIGPVDSVRPGRGARVVDGTGRFVIPGLWDLHVHQALRPWSDRPWEDNARYFHSLLLAHGVTSVRDMAGDLAILTQWRREIAEGKRLGPRQFVTGQKLGIAPVVPGAPQRLATAADVDSSVRMLARGGADFVKIDQVPVALMPAVRTATRQVGLPFDGHVSIDLSVVDAARFGQRGIEHMFGVLEAASTRETHIREVTQAPKAPFLDRLIDYVTKRGLPTSEERAVASLDRQKLQDMARTFASLGTAHIPTLRLNGIRFSVADSALLPPDDSLLIRPVDPHAGPWVFTPAQPGSKAARVWGPMCDAVRSFLAAGVVVLPGTDTPTLYAVPGKSLVEELVMLVRCGMTPQQALQSATSRAAAFMGQSAETGSIVVGKRADLVVLDADPIQNIGNLRLVHAVVVAGRLLERKVLDSLSHVAVSTARQNRAALRR